MTIATNKEWVATAELVESIIKARTVSKSTLKIVRGAVVKTDTTAPFRFIHFSRELGVDNGLAYRWIRGGVEPEPHNKKKVVKWCEKHRKHLK